MTEKGVSYLCMTNIIGIRLGAIPKDSVQPHTLLERIGIDFFKVDKLLNKIRIFDAHTEKIIQQIRQFLTWCFTEVIRCSMYVLASDIAICVHKMFNNIVEISSYKNRTAHIQQTINAINKI
jgi:hypothetical protein